MKTQDAADSKSFWSDLEAEAQLVDQDREHHEMTEDEQLEEQLDVDANFLKAQIQWYEEIHNNKKTHDHCPEYQAKKIGCTRDSDPTKMQIAKPASVIKKN